MSFLEVPLISGFLWETISPPVNPLRQAYIAAEVPPRIRGRITAQIAGAQKWAIMKPAALFWSKKKGKRGNMDL